MSVSKQTGVNIKWAVSFSDGDKDSDGPSESGDNTSESTQGAPSEPAQEKGTRTI